MSPAERVKREKEECAVPREANFVNFEPGRCHDDAGGAFRFLYTFRTKIVRPFEIPM